MMEIVAAMMITIITIINHDLLTEEALKGLFIITVIACINELNKK